MKRKRLALLLAAVMTVTSIDGTAFAVSGADFSSEPVEKAQAEADGHVHSLDAEDDFSAGEAGISDEAAAPEPAEEQAVEKASGGADGAAESLESAQTDELTQDDSENADTAELETPDSAQNNAGSDSTDLGFGDGSVSVDGGESSTEESVIPDNAQELTPGTSYDVNVDEDEKEAWFSFTASESAIYTFYSEGSEDTVGCVYDRRDVADKDDYLKLSDNDGEEKNFKISLSMRQGTTYYFCARLFNENNPGSFTVKLEKVQTPSSVQINTSNITRTEYRVGLDECYLPGLEMTAVYDDGREPETLTFSKQWELLDSYGNVFSYGFRRDESAMSYGAGCTIPEEGTWYAAFYCNDELITTDAACSIQIKELGDLPELSEGDNTIESPDDDYNWYKFTAPETATYVVSPVVAFKICRQSDLEEADFEWGDEGPVIPMEEGETYCLGFMESRFTGDGEEKTNQWTLNIKKEGSDSEDKDSIIPENVQELTPDTDYDVDIDEGGKEAWFSFTPEEDGTYSFFSEGDNDTFGYVYNKPDVTDKEDYLNRDDDSGENTNFRLNVTMTKGTTYYFCVQMLNTEVTGSFTVRLEKAQSVSSIQIDTSKLVKKEYIPSLDDCYLAGLEMTVQYGEGKEPETIKFSTITEMTDSYGNTFTYKFQSADGKDDQIYEPGNRMVEGTWNIIFYCNGIPIETDATYSIQVKEPTDLPILQAGEENSIESQWKMGMYNWYEFIAPETAEYKISPVNAYRTLIVNASDHLEVDRIITNDDGVVVSVEEGKKYYVGFQGSRTTEEGETNQWTVNIEKKASVSSLSFDKEEVTLTSVTGSDIGMYTPTGTVTVSYADGSSSDPVEVTLGAGSSDKFGNIISPRLTNSNGDEISWIEDGTNNEVHLQAGTYKLTYSIGDGDNAIMTEEIPVTVQELDFNNLPKLTYGTNTIKTANENNQNPIYYAFEAEKDGSYIFDYNRDDDGWDYLSASWYRINDDGELEEFDPEYQDGGLGMSQGKYLVSWYNQKGDDEAAITVKAVPSITSVKVRSWKSVDSVVIEKTGNAFLKELVVEVTYEDGTTKELTYDSDDSTDEYGRSLFYTFTHCKNEDGDYPEVEDPEHLTAGDYVYRVAVGSVYAEDIPFKVVSRDAAVTKELTTGTTELENQDGLLLKYKAPADGRYELAVNVPITELCIRKEDETEIEHAEVTDYRAYASFEENETYYIYVNVYEYCPELKVTISPLTRPEFMETTALKKTYIAGIDHFDENDVETKVSFEGQKTRTIRGTDIVEGYGLNYRVENTEGEEYDSEEPLTVGEWTVTPYLSASVQTGSAVAVDMSQLPVKSDTFTAKKFDLSTLKALKENTWTEIRYEDYDQYYVFTATEDGTYTAVINEYNVIGSARFYADKESGYSDCGHEISLKKGESCLVKSDEESDIKIKITKQENMPTITPQPTEIPEQVTEIALEDGLMKKVSYKGQDILCTFTPSKDGCYELGSYMLSSEDESVDTYVELYCGSDRIASDDDSGYAGNFRLVWKLEKGKEYTYHVRTFDREDGDFELSFSKIEAKKVKDVELVPMTEEDGFFRPGFSDTVICDILSTYQMKLIYEDNTSYTTELWSSEDIYQNKIKIKTTSDDKASGKILRYNISFTIKLPWESEEEAFTKTLTGEQKGYGSFDQLQEGVDSPLTKEEQYYCFTPEESGKYIISAKEPEDGTVAFIVEESAEYPSDGFVDRFSVESRYQGRCADEFYLKAGKTYLVTIGNIGEGTIKIQKENKILKGLELVKAPEQTVCIANDRNYVSLKGLQVKALYTDGSTENITYGEADSCGRRLYKKDVKWNADGKCTVYVNLGDYQVSFDMDSASREQVQELKPDQTVSVKAEYDDVLTYKFIPEVSAYYVIDVDGGNVLDPVESDSPEDNVYYRGQYLLKAGKTYYIHVNAWINNINIVVRLSSCLSDGHKWDDGEVTKEATCKEEGERTYTCSVCGSTKTEAIEKLTTHTWDNGKITKAATCKESGVKTYTCTVCGATKTEDIAKTTDHTWDGGKVTKAATCKEEGVKTYTCSVCGATRTESIAKTTDHKWDSGKVTKAATCKEEGVKTYTCSVCGATRTESIAKTTDHKWDSGKVTKAATCKETGVKTYTCAVCGATRTESIAKLTTHTWDGGKVTKTATCKEAGVKTYTCTVCGTTKTEAIAKTSDHKWDSGKVTKAATCKEEGVKTYTCSVCGATRTESIAKTTDHKWDSGKVTKAATCKETGVKTYTCTVCGTTKTEAIAKTTDHKWDSGKVTKATTCKEAGVKTYTCTVCGATRTESIAKLTTHTWDGGKVTKAATCKEAGVKTYTCTVCGATKTEAIAKTTDHKWDSGKVTKAATCKETGVKTYTCTVCGATKTEAIAKTTDHKWDSGKVTKAATCKEAGVKTYTCTVCGATKTEAIAKTTDHKWDNGKVTKAATCKEAGVKTYTCTVCGATRTESIAKLTTHAWDGGKVTKAATCKEAGVKTYTCTVCGATKTEAIAKTTNHKWDNGKVTKAATCKEAGVKTYTCSVCGETRTESVAKLTTHTWNGGKVTKAATCKEAGVKTYTCTVCGATRTESIAKTTDHKWDNGKVTKAATCKEAGVKTYTCTVCGATKTEAIAKTTDHKWDNGKVTKAATCKETGVKTYTCTVCKATRTESIPKITDHKWDNGKVSKEATCKEEGVKTYTCSICGMTKTETIAKTGHKFGKWTKVSDATIKVKQKQKRTCSVCKKTEYRYVGKVLAPTIKLSVTSMTLQQNQSSSAVKVTMARGDSVKSWVSNNRSVATVNKNGIIKAQKKNGTAKITVTLKSGKKATVTVKVQSKKITTSKITGLKSKVTLKKGKTLALKPVLSPVTSQDKITYATSNKSVATVNSRGVITAKKNGTARITVKAGKKSYVVNVTVTK